MGSTACTALEYWRIRDDKSGMCNPEELENYGCKAWYVHNMDIWRMVHPAPSLSLPFGYAVPLLSMRALTHSLFFPYEIACACSFVSAPAPLAAPAATPAPRARGAAAVRGTPVSAVAPVALAVAAARCAPFAAAVAQCRRSCPAVSVEFCLLDMMDAPVASVAAPPAASAGATCTWSADLGLPFLPAYLVPRLFRFLLVLS